MPEKTTKSPIAEDETGSFKLLSTSELAEEAGVTAQYIGKLKRAGVIKKVAYGKYAERRGR
jgi:hypothetical protein